METGAVQVGELLRVRNDADGGWHLEGEVDTSNADALLDLIRPARPVRSDVELDLTALSYMDSSGIRVIVVLLKELDGGSHRMVLRVREGPVARVLRISDLASLPNLVIEMIGALAPAPATGHGEEPPAEAGTPQPAAGSAAEPAIDPSLPKAPSTL